MFLIFSQFVLELLLTMCKAYQDFLNKTIYKNIIIGLICSINFKTFLILEVQHIYQYLYNFPFQFISFYPNASIICLFGFEDVLLCYLIVRTSN